MNSLPPGAAPYSRSPEFSETTVPEALRRRHQTKRGVWARICVLEGRLRYRVLASEPPEEFTLSPEQPGIAAPEVPHCVEPLGAVRFFIEFLRE